MEPIDFVVGLLSGLLTGLVVGYIVEHYRFKNGLKIERMKRLTPHVEVVHPILEELWDDVSYFKKSQLRKDNSENHEFTERIMNAFNKYALWYQEFQSNGLKPELASFSKSLSSWLNGLFVHSQMTKKYGEDHISREINEIFNSTKNCLSEVEEFLTA